MPVNLLNEATLNRYIRGLYGVPQTFEQPQFQHNFQDLAYIEQHTDDVTRTIVYQYMKHRIRSYLIQDEAQPFLIPVPMRFGLPNWAVKAISENRPVFEFNGDKITPQLRTDLTTIQDFLYSSAESYINKSLTQAKESKGKLKIHLDYLKTNNEYDTFEKVLEQAEKWHQLMAERAEEKARDEQLYQSSLKGTEFAMDLPNGMKAYRLTTAEALDFESEYMGHCVGKGSYDTGVKNGSIQIYSIRDQNGAPHATLEMRNNEVRQCKGKGNKMPVQRYIPAVQALIKNKKWEVTHDIKNTGLIKQDGKYYSIFDLPEDFVVKGDLDLSEMDLTGVNLNITVEGSLNLYRCQNLPKHLNLSGVKSVNLSETDLLGIESINCPTHALALSQCRNLPKHLDFSNMSTLFLRGTDLAGVESIKWPKDLLDLGCVNNLPKQLDLSGVKEVNLSDNDLSGINIIWPQKEINLSRAWNLPNHLDLSHLETAILGQIDFSNVKSIKCPTKYLMMDKAKNMPKWLDLSSVEKASIEYADFSGVESIQCPYRSIVLRGSCNFPKLLDFSNTECAYLSYADLSGVETIKAASVYMDFDLSENMPPYLDLSKSERVEFHKNDLSTVKSIIWPKNGNTWITTCIRTPNAILDSYFAWRQKDAIERTKIESQQNKNRMAVANTRV